MPRDDDFEDDFEDNSRDFEDEGFEDEGFEDDAASGLGSEGDYSEAEKEGDDQTARQTGMTHEEYSMDLDAEADASDADAPANAPETDNPDTPAPADAHAYSDAEADAYADAYEDEADEPLKARHGGMARHETEDFSMDDFDPEDADASNANAHATDRPASMPAADAEADADAAEYEEEAEDTAERHNAGHSRLKRLETEEYFLDEEADAAPLGSTQKLPEEAAEGSLGNEDLLEAVQRFRAGRFAEASELARKAVENCQGALGAESPPETEGDAEADAWRAAMDRLAGAHEACGDVERAEALYLRMLAWREGAEQVEAGNCKVGETLFKKSCHYRSVEDATWFLHTLRPDDGHAGAEAVALLALGEEVAAKAAVAVWTLALRASQREQLTQCGAVELMAKALAFHPGPELQAAGCGVLRLLCSGHRLAAQNRRMLISRLGGAESVTNAMRAHPQDMEVMREACGALRAMAHKNPAGARRIIDNDGFKLCMEAIESPDEAVAGAACKAIAAMQCAAQEPDEAGIDKAMAHLEQMLTSDEAAQVSTPAATFVGLAMALEEKPKLGLAALRCYQKEYTGKGSSKNEVWERCVLLQQLGAVSLRNGRLREADAYLEECAELCAEAEGHPREANLFQRAFSTQQTRLEREFAVMVQKLHAKTCAELKDHPRAHLHVAEAKRLQQALDGDAVERAEALKTKAEVKTDEVKQLWAEEAEEVRLKEYRFLDEGPTVLVMLDLNDHLQMGEDASALVSSLRQFRVNCKESAASTSSCGCGKLGGWWH
ncbi:unnamed protein product [Effrenium voratum]|nr:unnamed protein product [Effrenium voratum]